MTGSRRHAALILLLCVVALAAYSDSFNGWFVRDNESLILSNPWVQDVTGQNVLRLLTSDYWLPKTMSGLYRPVSSLTYLLNYAVLGGGIVPFGYHWFNFGLHCLNMALVYLLFVRLFGRTDLAFAAAALWGLHPVLTESVTNIIGRSDLLAGASVLGGLLLHIRAGEADGMRKAPWIAALGITATIGMFSKESASLLPAVMALYDFILFGRDGWRPRAAGYLAVLPPLLLYWTLRSMALAGEPASLVPFTDNPLAHTGFWTAHLTAVKVLGRYLWLLVFPHTLSSDYSYNQIPLVTWRFDSWQDWQAIASLAVCALLAAAAALCYRRSKPACFLLAFAFLCLLPTANLIRPVGTIMAERFLYLPAIGFAGCVAAAIFHLLNRRAAAVACAVLCCALGARTYARNLDWHTPESLARADLAACPNSWKTHLAMALLLHARMPESLALNQAIAEIARSVAILDGLPVSDDVQIPHILAGDYYTRKGDLAKSSWWYEKALTALLRAAEIDHLMHRDLPSAGGAPPESIYFGNPLVYHELGGVYMRLHRYRDALATYEFGGSLPGHDSVFPDEIDRARKALKEASP